jgi:cytochrome P450
MTSRVDDFVFPSPEVNQCPFSFHAALREEVPVYRLANQNTYLITRYDDVVRVAKDFESFSSRRPWPSEDMPGIDLVPEVPGLVNNDPPDHTAFRAVLTKAFSPSSVAQLEPQLSTIANQLIDDIGDDREFDFVTRFSSLFPMHVITTIMGWESERFPTFKRWADHMSEFFAFLGTHVDQEHAQSIKELREYLLEQIGDRTRNPRADLMTVVAQGRDDKGQLFALNQRLELARVLFTGGNETTSFLLGNTLNLLLSNPVQFARVREDRSLLPRLINESLRLESPNEHGTRVATRDVTIDGVTIPAGATVLLRWGAANRDAAHFEDPDAMDLGRTYPASHLAFGKGIHFCLGAHLARLEGRIAFETIFDRWADIKRQLGTEDVPMIEHPLFRAPSSLPIEIVPSAG